MGRRGSGKNQKAVKRCVNITKKRKYSAVSRGRNRFLEGNPGKPKGAVSLKTRIVNELLATFPEIKGKQMIKTFAKSGNRNFAKYMDYIVALIRNGKIEVEHSGEIGTVIYLPKVKK